MAAVFLPLAAAVQSQTPPSQQRARQAYDAAQARFQNAPADPEAAWQFGRAAYDVADLSDDNDQRKTVAELGADACRKAIAQNPDVAPAHYYLALNLSELAQVKRFSALKILHQMEHALLTAQQLDPKLDYAGPDRSLGMLYLEAPPHPLSLGNRSNARRHLEAAVRLAPDYPENRICLAEAYARWEEGKNLESQLSALDKLLPDARTRFDPATWQANWRDWDARLVKLRKLHDQLQAHPRVSPSERGARSTR